jgi:hypothetical protein
VFVVLMVNMRDEDPDGDEDKDDFEEGIHPEERLVLIIGLWSTD